MFKKVYKLSRFSYMSTLTYSEVRFKDIMFVKCREEGRDPKAFCADVFKCVGSERYTWALANETLDVNAPVHKRYDLYACNDKTNPVLLASVFEEGSTYHCYQYNGETEMLTYLTDSETLEDAKSTLEVLSVME